VLDEQDLLRAVADLARRCPERVPPDPLDAVLRRRPPLTLPAQREAAEG
jgi:hypothetical protein